MQKVIFSIYDQVTKVYSTPFFCANSAHGQRLFRNAVNDPNSEIKQNPQDYSLVELGRFDDETGAIEYTPLNMNPINGSSFKE